MKKIIMIVFSSYFLASSAVANTQCPTGQNFNSKVNRCLTTAQTARLQQEIKTKCRGIEGEAYNKCYYESAMNTLSDEGIDETKGHQAGFKGSNAGLPIASTATLMSGYYLLRKGKQCNALSLKLMFAAASATMLGDLGANITYRKMLKNDIKEYKKSVSAEDDSKSEQAQIENSQFNQVKAFDFLIDQEKSKRTALQIRGGAYAAGGGLYAGAVVAAVMEAIKTSTGSTATCKFAETKPAETTTPVDIDKVIEESPTIDNIHFKPNLNGIQQGNAYFQNQIHLDLYTNKNNYVFTNQYRYELKSTIENDLIEYEKMADSLLAALDKNDSDKFINILASFIGMPSAYAQVSLAELEKGKGGAGNILDDIMSIMAPAIGAGALIKGFDDKFLGQVFTTPVGRGAFSAVLGTYSSVVSVDSFKKAKQSKERMDAIEKVKKSINESPTTLAGCTVADRKDSSKPACYCYNDNNEQNMARSNQQVCKTQWGEVNIAGATDYNQSGTSSSNSNICLSSTYKVDENCSCRSSTGASSCLSFGNISGFDNIGAVSYGNSLQDLANQVTSGNYSSGNALAQAGNNLAMKGKQIAEQMAKQNKDADKVLKAINSQASKLQNAHSRAMGGSGMNNMANRSLFDANPLSNIDPKKAVEEVEKSIAAAQAYETGKAQAKKSEANDNMNFDFGGGSSQGSIVVEDDLNEVMDKDFNYAENDINNRPSDSIFKILTLRYQTSGLRRLFDDKNEFQAEAATGNEIHGN